MTSLYCGNNKLNKKLLNGTASLGTRYECLRNGIGVGLNLPWDSEYDEYEPIDKTIIYCGNKNRMPNGYDRVGSILECHRKGVGIGKKIKSKKMKSRSRRKSVRRRRYHKSKSRLSRHKKIRK